MFKSYFRFVYWINDGYWGNCKEYLVKCLYGFCVVYLYV